jgi:ATP-dependent Lon protease
VQPSGTGGLRDLIAALDDLALFPLPTLLFPGALLPLHVFEPRYRAMVKDALDGSRVLAVVLIAGQDGVDAQGHPRIAQVATAGEVVDHVELPGGRFNVLVRGRARVQLHELPFGEKPYRRARATILDSSGDATAQDVAALFSTANAFAARVREREPKFDFPVAKDLPAGALADLCAHHLVLDARERQTILETLDVGARVRRVTDALALQRLALGSDPRDVN